MSPTQPNIEIVKSEPDKSKNLQKISLVGEIDRDTIPIFREKMEEFLKDFNFKNLILDLEKLEFINSEGIGFLSDIHNRLSTNDKKVMIIKASDRIMDIFQLVGLNQIIPCYSSEEECLNSL